MLAAKKEVGDIKIEAGIDKVGDSFSIVEAISLSNKIASSVD
jgi:hypothetical protein